MKRLIAVLGITAGLVAPLSAQNTPGNERTPAKVKAVSNSRCIYYVTSVPSTGSHIPVVIRRYRGTDAAVFGSSPGSRYTSGDIGLTGSLTVQGALYTLDPAFSSAR
jgi:hypothetical protein